jgi:Tfp pilus assembly protein PilF
MQRHPIPSTLGNVSSPWHSRVAGGLIPERLALLLLFSFSVLLYVGTTSFGLVVDDTLLLAHNPYLRSFHYIKEIFSQDFWGFRGATGATGYYRPVVMFTLLLERTLFGPNPAGFHLVNAFLNGLVVILVYRLARSLWPEGSGPLWAGALFAALPLHMENVIPVSGISDLECALFTLLSIWVYLRHGDSRPTAWSPSAWLAAGCFTLAVLSKEVALVLPLLLVFHDVVMRADKPPRLKTSLGKWTPFFLVVALYLGLRLQIFGSVTKAAAASLPGLKQTVLSALSLTGIYAFKLVWPQHLAYIVKLPPPDSWHDLYVVLGAVVLLLAAAAFRRFRREDPRVSFAIVWFFLFLGPVLNVRWLGLATYGERYLYLPSVAFCWLAGEGLARLSRSAPREQRARFLVVRALPWVLLALWMGRTALRLPDWKNDKTLALATLREAPETAMSRIYLGNSYRHEGELNLARQEYVAAIASDPSIYEAYVDLATMLEDDGAVEGARALFRRAAAVNPRAPEVFYGWGAVEQRAGNLEAARQLFQHALGLNPNSADALNSLAVISMGQGKLEEAEAYLAAAARADPSSLAICLNRGILLARKGDLGRAEVEFRRAAELAPESEAPYLSLAGLYEEQGKQSAAMDMYEKALQVRPSSPTALFRRGVLALKIGDVPAATSSLEKVARIQPDSALVHTQLGLAYRTAGRLAEARRELEISLRLEPDDKAAKEALRELK